MLLLCRDSIKEKINFIVNFNQKYKIVVSKGYHKPCFTVKSRKDNRYVATLFIDDYYGEKVFTTSMFVDYDRLSAQIDVAYFLNVLSSASIFESSIHLETLYTENELNNESSSKCKAIERNTKKQIKNLMRKVKNV